jgi:hypothetical protein
MEGAPSVIETLGSEAVRSMVKMAHIERHKGRGRPPEWIEEAQPHSISVMVIRDEGARLRPQTHL